MSSQFDLGEISLSNRLDELIVADVDLVAVMRSREATTAVRRRRRRMGSRSSRRLKQKRQHAPSHFIHPSFMERRLGKRRSRSPRLYRPPPYSLRASKSPLLRFRTRFESRCPPPPLPPSSLLLTFPRCTRSGGFSATVGSGDRVDDMSLRAWLGLSAAGRSSSSRRTKTRCYT